MKKELFIPYLIFLLVSTAGCQTIKGVREDIDNVKKARAVCRMFAACYE